MVRMTSSSGASVLATVTRTSPREDTEAVGLEVDPKTGDVKEPFKKTTTDTIEHVTPSGAGAFTVTTKSETNPLKLPLEVPAGALRERIWRSLLLPSVPLAADVDVNQLAKRYELTGGAIRSAVLYAVSKAVAALIRPAPR